MWRRAEEEEMERRRAEEEEMERRKYEEMKRRAQEEEEMRRRMAEEEERRIMAEFEELERRKYEEEISQLKSIETMEMITRKKIQLPRESFHSYDQKFFAIENAASLSLSAILNTLFVLNESGNGGGKGTETALLKYLLDPSPAHHTTTLRFCGIKWCELSSTYTRQLTQKKEKEEEEEEVMESSFFQSSKKRVVTEIEVFKWKCHFDFQFFFYRGSDPRSQSFPLLKKSKFHYIETTSETLPHLSVEDIPPIDTNLTFLLNHMRRPLDSSSLFDVDFKIDRLASQCRTPSRNPLIDEMMKFSSSFYKFCSAVDVCLKQSNSVNFDLTNQFIPVIPFLSSTQNSIESEQEVQKVPSSPLLSSITREHHRSISKKFSELYFLYPKEEGEITLEESYLIVFARHGMQISKLFQKVVQEMEKLLLDQMQSVLGKLLAPSDFLKYLRYHHRVLFKKEFSAAPFCYPIKWKNRCPDGVLSIEEKIDNPIDPTPILAFHSDDIVQCPMSFALSAGTKVTIEGNRVVHGWVTTEFNVGQGVTKGSQVGLSLCARARQFSGFVLVVGRIASKETFLPLHAIILQNKEEIVIPLLLDPIPTPGEFKDAISSLSPEQQRFCTSYRNKQLASSLLGVCVIDIRSHLEKILLLPVNSLTKEIELVQLLMELLVEYQIPSDLFRYDGERNGNGIEEDDAAKVRRVRELAREIKKMIVDEQQEQLAEKLRQEEMKREEERRRREEERRRREEEIRERERAEREMREMERRRQERIRFPYGDLQSAISKREEERSFLRAKMYEENEKRKKKKRKKEKEFLKRMEELELEREEKKKSLDEAEISVREGMEMGLPLEEMREREKLFEFQRLVYQEQEKIIEETKQEFERFKIEYEKEELAAKMWGEKRLMGLEEEIMMMQRELERMMMMMEREREESERKCQEERCSKSQDMCRREMMEMEMMEREREMMEEKRAMAMEKEQEERREAEDEGKRVKEEIKEEQQLEEVETKDQDQQELDKHDSVLEEDSLFRDFSALPRSLDMRFSSENVSSLRMTTVQFGSNWSMNRPGSLSIKKMIKSIVFGTKKQKTEKEKAFDLLDALSKSGSVNLESASVHILLVAVHSFSRDLMETLIQENRNPVEEVERSLLLVASEISGRPQSELILESQRKRLTPIL